MLGLKLVLSFIGVLTLAIGGVGVMNIMFVSVTRADAGDRAAQGARRAPRRDPLAVPARRPGHDGRGRRHSASLLSAVLVWLLSPRPFLSELLDDSTGTADIHLLLSFELVAICTAILVVVGLVSSFVPALRASRMDPIEALRHE